MSSERAASLVASILGKGPWTCKPFGAGRFSETFHVKGSGFKEYVLRVAPSDELLQLFYEYRMMRQEPAILARLSSETDVPVPRLVGHDFSRKQIDRDYVILERLPGIPLSVARFSSQSLDGVYRQWGRYVREIHEVVNADQRFGYLGEHNCMEPQNSWADAFSIMMEKELEDIEKCGCYSQADALSVWDLFGRFHEVFENRGQPSLLHGDLWVTNVLVNDEGAVTGVIDFDRACWGDTEWDLAIAEYCGVTTPAFWEGYGMGSKPNSQESAIRRFFYLLYEHQKYVVISMSSRRNDPSRAQCYVRDCLNAVERFRSTGYPLF